MSPQRPRPARLASRSFRTRVWDYLFGHTVPARPRTALGFEPLEAREVPAAVAVTLFGTGVGTDGSLLANDATDPHYELISNGGTSLMPGPARTLTADGFPIGPWVGNGSDSRWIVPAATDGDGNAAVGTFDYRTTFDLTGIDPSTVSISGQWAADNDATIALNGVDTGVSVASEDFRSLAAFSLTSGFRAGVNTLDFIVHNAGGPTGLRVASLTGVGEETGQIGTVGVAFNTGVDAAGQPLAAAGTPAVTGLHATGAGLSDGSPDGNFTLSQAPAGYEGATKVMSADGNFPFPYWVGTADSAGSAWLVPAAADDQGNAPAGDYWFATTVDVTDPTNLVVSGSWAADDQAAIFVNGVATGVTLAAPAYGAMTPFQLAGSYFTAGANTVEFRVTNGGSSANPTGLRVAWDAQSPTLDPHWTVVDAPDPSLVGPTKVVPSGGYPFPNWVANTGYSQWISPLNAAADGSAVPGTYKYQTTIDLTGYDPATAVLSGRWSADNEGVNVYLNGVPLNLSVSGPNPGTGVEGYRGYAALYVAHGVGNAAFQAGVNTLTFEVRNDRLGSANSSENPVGLRIDRLQLSATPTSVSSTIQGAVWVDVDQDRYRDGNELGLAGVQVALADTNGNTIGVATTGKLGFYSFSEVPPGDYSVKFTAPSGFALDGNSTDYTTTTVVASQTSSIVNVPAYQNDIASVVSGRVFLDTVDLPGLPAVTVTLLGTDGQAAVNTSGEVVAPVETDLYGRYMFSGLPQGSYTVEFSAPPGFRLRNSGTSTLAGPVETPGPNSVLDQIAYQVPSVTISPATQTIESGAAGWSGWWGANGVLTLTRAGGDLAQSLPTRIRFGAASNGNPLAVFGDDFSVSNDGMPVQLDANYETSLTFAPGQSLIRLVVTTAQMPDQINKGFSVTVLDTPDSVPVDRNTGIAGMGGFSSDVTIQHSEPSTEPLVNLVAHRTGDYFGQVVTTEVENGGDPGDFVVLVADPNGAAESAAAAPTGPDLVPDNNLVWVTLSQLPTGLIGSISLELASSDARVFKQDGSPLTDLSLDLNNPSGYLSDLLSHDVGVWIQAINLNPDFVLTFAHRDPEGTILDSDTVHICFAQISITNSEGLTSPLYNVLPQSTLEALNSVSEVPDASLYKVHLSGLTREQIDSVSVTSSAGSYDDILDETADGMRSANFGIFYNSDQSSPIAASVLEQIYLNLGLHAAAAQDPKIETKTAKDKFTLNQKFTTLQIKQEDPLAAQLKKQYPEISTSVVRLIYDSVKPISFTLDDALPPGSKIEWDLNGDGKFGVGDYEKATTASTVVTFSKEKDSATNIHIDNIAANRRLVLTVGVLVTPPERDPIPIKVPIRIALETNRVLNDLPGYLPGQGGKYDADKTQAYLNKSYAYASYPTNQPNLFLPWTDLEKFPKEDQAVMFASLGANDAATVKNFNDNRLVVGSGPNAQAGERAADSYISITPPTPQFTHPDSKVAGTFLYGGNNSYAFSYDAPELTYFVAHEREQIGSVKRAVTGQDVSTFISDMYALSRTNNQAVKAQAGAVFELWNRLNSTFADFLHVSTPGAFGGNVSWAFYSSQLRNFWTLYRSILKGTGVGTLSNLKALDASGDLAFAKDGKGMTPYEIGVAQMKFIYDNIVKAGPDWADLVNNQNKGTGPNKNEGPLYLLYRFEDPSTLLK